MQPVFLNVPQCLHFAKPLFCHSPQCYHCLFSNYASHSCFCHTCKILSQFSCLGFCIISCYFAKIVIFVSSFRKVEGFFFGTFGTDFWELNFWELNFRDLIYWNKNIYQSNYNAVGIKIRDNKILETFEYRAFLHPDFSK